MANFTTNYDRITAAAQNNHLSGGGSDDARNGQAGNDTLTGGTRQKIGETP